jgi:hypothetical protein
MHQRRIIRNAFVARILAAETGAQDRVFGARETPVDAEDLIKEGPIVLVYTRKDSAKREDYPQSGFDGGVKRCLEIAVEITAAGSWIVDDKLDDLAEQIEALFEADWAPDGMPATEIRLMSTEIDSTEAFQQPIGGAYLLFEADYWRPYRTDDDTPFCADETFVRINGGPAELVSSCVPGECEPVENIALTL